ncbi:MAG TPA: type II toxin-antitoxin system Phd/YefM family antitoxin [Rubrivivax sp.]|nr:type II toxin-antitoxin system Phd/YefM family antitoxin [Rubrivivax sp.]
MPATRWIGLEEARSRLPELVRTAGEGSAHVITRHGRPVAALVPLSTLSAARRRANGVLALRGTGLWDAQAARAIEKLRSDWD